MMEEPRKKLIASEAFPPDGCRICLQSNVKMYSLNDPYLAGCMKSIGLNDESKPWLPKLICYECVATLIKCNKFIEKSKVVEDLVFGLRSGSNELYDEVIKEQHKIQMKLRTPLECYLLQDYYYIRHDDDDNATNDASNQLVKVEHDDAEDIGLMEILARCVPSMRLISPLSEDPMDDQSPIVEHLHQRQSSDAIDDLPTQEGQAVLAPEEMAHDDDVVAIEEEVPVVEIISDEENVFGDDQRNGDDRNAVDNMKTNDVMYFDVNVDAHGSTAVAAQSVPVFPKKRLALSSLSDIQIPKPRKKKKKKHKEIQEIEDDDRVKQSFRIEVLKVKDRMEKKYTCKYCSQSYSYGDEAKDHYVLGCPKRNSSDSSSSLTPSSGVKTWQEWPGSS